MKDKVETKIVVKNIFKDGSTVFDPNKDISDIVAFIISTTMRNRSIEELREMGCLKEEENEIKDSNENPKN